MTLLQTVFTLPACDSVVRALLRVVGDTWLSPVCVCDLTISAKGVMYHIIKQ